MKNDFAIILWFQKLFIYRYLAGPSLTNMIIYNVQATCNLQCDGLWYSWSFPYYFDLKSSWLFLQSCSRCKSFCRRLSFHRPGFCISWSMSPYCQSRWPGRICIPVLVENFVEQSPLMEMQLKTAFWKAHPIINRQADLSGFR